MRSYSFGDNRELPLNPKYYIKCIYINRAHLPLVVPKRKDGDLR